MRASCRFRNKQTIFRLIGLVLTLLLGCCVSLQRSGAQPPTPEDTGRVKSSVKEILAQPEFRPDSANDPMGEFARSIQKQTEDGRKWLQRRWDAFIKWLNSLFSVTAGTAGLLSYAVLYLFMAVFCALLVWLIVKIVRERRSKRAAARVRSTAFDEFEESEEAIVKEPEAWLRQSDQYAADGDYRRAFRAVFIAILLLLDRAGTIEFDRARTNGDYLKALRSNDLQQLFEKIRPLVRDFDYRWYGDETTTREDVRDVTKAFDEINRLLNEAPVGSEPAMGGA